MKNEVTQTRHNLESQHGVWCMYAVESAIFASLLQFLRSS